MDTETIEENIKREVTKDDWGGDDFGGYHPSEISGCPLKVFLEKMAEVETTISSWLFQGSAVHYYLQEAGILTEALKESGYHPVDLRYEVSTNKELDDDLWITGSCDVLASDDDNLAIFDIKYTSLKVENNPERLYKYFSQLNTYAQMFGADEYALIIINSRSRNLEENIYVLEGEPDEENWDIMKGKARDIHDSLDSYGYGEGERWTADEVHDFGMDTWEDILEFFDNKQIPAYDKECNYCEFEDSCPINNGKVSKGLDSFKGGA